MPRGAGEVEGASSGNGAKGREFFFFLSFVMVEVIATVFIFLEDVCVQGEFLFPLLGSRYSEDHGDGRWRGSGAEKARDVDFLVG